MTKGSVVHWFRKGLRVHDNAGLLDAWHMANDAKITLKPVFLLDPWFVKNAKVGTNRWRFLIQTLEDLDKSLRKIGTRLFVIKGSPEEIFPKLLKKWDVKRLTWEQDIEPYAVDRDNKIEKIAKQLNVEVLTFCGHTLYELDAIVAKNKGDVPLTYQKLQGLVSKMGHPAKPVDPPTKLSKESRLDSGDLEKTKYDVPDLDSILKTANKSKEDLGPCKFHGGETEALRRLDEKISAENKAFVLKFEKPSTSPNSIEPSTTVLSPYLKFGCLSPRTFYYRLLDVYKLGKHSEPPVSLMGQLFWREFFYTVGSHTPNFDKMKGNKVCRQIDWDTNADKLKAWTEARTGFPYIDAIMTQLRLEGWIHHLARHSVACFLTRGDLYQSWEKGMEVFEELLLDADWALNAGNWMWLSASAFFHQYYRVYSPVAFGKKTDPSGEYIRKYLPQLSKFPDKFIYQPWEAPLATQKAAGCIIGQDYPRPIVDHSVIHKVNMDRMKKAYAAGKSGKEPPKKKQKTMDSFIKKE